MAARHRTGTRSPLTDGLIAHRADRNIGVVVRWGRLESWSSMTVKDVDDFLRGCGYSYGELAELRRYIKRTLKSATPFAHLNHLNPRTISSIARACERAGDAKIRSDLSAASAHGPSTSSGG
jgi:hypothetical protein